jgi:hypothetical protein
VDLERKKPTYISSNNIVCKYGSLRPIDHAGLNLGSHSHVEPCNGLISTGKAPHSVNRVGYASLIVCVASDEA